MGRSADPKLLDGDLSEQTNNLGLSWKSPNNALIFELWNHFHQMLVLLPLFFGNFELAAKLGGRARKLFR
jgi:hypothetical protein